MIEATGARVPWAQLPRDVRSGVERMLGFTVVSAVSQPGGFSPGSADRIVCADGSRVFVKTALASANPEVLGIHRREAAVNAWLPARAPAPRLRGVVDQGDWVALAFDDVAGAQPALPWSSADVDAVLAALDVVATIVPDEAGRGVLGDAADELAPLTTSWPRIGNDPTGLRTVFETDVGAWLSARVDEWAARATDRLDIVSGDTLVHFDVRADNTLIRPDGAAVLVDWPWALRGGGGSIPRSWRSTCACTTPRSTSSRSFARADASTWCRRTT